MSKNYTIEKAKEAGIWRISNGVTFLSGFKSKMEAKFFIRRYLAHVAAGKRENA